MATIFQKNLINILNERKLTQSELAKKTGITQSSISDYINGKYEPKQDKVDAIASALNVRPSFLVGKAEPSSDHSAYGLLPVTKHKIPVLGTVAAGTPIFADEDLETYIDPQDIDADFALHVKGNSMIGDGINDNDVVYVRKQGVVGQGEIAVVLVEDEATLKHVYTAYGEIQLVASNPSYPPIIIRDSDHKNVSILGKAVGVFRSLNSQTKED